MPSEDGNPEPVSQPAARGWLRSQGLGILCGQATVLLLAVGSVQLARSRGGGVTGWFSDDLRIFFREPSWSYLWLYLLVPVLGLLALNTALCTWHNVALRWRAGVRSLAAYGPAVIHAGFLLALGAHAVEGFLAEEPEAIAVGPDWTPLPVARAEGRVASFAMDRHPDGSPKRIRAELELRDGPSGKVRRETVGINHPLSSGFGARLHLVADFASRLDTARFVSEDGNFELRIDSPSPPVAGLRLLGIERSSDGYRSRPVAVVRGEGWEAPILFPYGEAVTLPGGGTLRLEAVERHDWLLLRPRLAPGNPWALAAALLVLAGCAMMGRRWF